jgi:hypothetical protein
VLLLANVVGYPVYWYAVHWRRPEQLTAGR